MSTPGDHWERGGVLHLESTDSDEDGAAFVKLDDGGLEISVTEEQAVDSNNEMFTCTVHLSAEQVSILREWLAKNKKPAAE